MRPINQENTLRFTPDAIDLDAQIASRPQASCFNRRKLAKPMRASKVLPDALLEDAGLAQ
jgi:hypothetical protein